MESLLINKWHKDIAAGRMALLIFFKNSNLVAVRAIIKGKEAVNNSFFRGFYDL